MNDLSRNEIFYEDSKCMPIKIYLQDVLFKFVIDRH